MLSPMPETGKSWLFWGKGGQRKDNSCSHYAPSYLNVKCDSPSQVVCTWHLSKFKPFPNLPSCGRINILLLKASLSGGRVRFCTSCWCLKIIQGVWGSHTLPVCGRNHGLWIWKTWLHLAELKQVKLLSGRVIASMQAGTLYRWGLQCLAWEVAQEACQLLPRIWNQ